MTNLTLRAESKPENPSQKREISGMILETWTWQI